MTQSCTRRVSDHYESWSCGAACLPGNTYCLSCRPGKLLEARRFMDLTQEEFRVAKAAYDQLLAEGVPK